MARLTARERRERAAALQAQVEYSRRVWLGKRVLLVDLLDDKTKEGLVTDISEKGYVTVEYQMFPWPDEPAILCTQVGHEAEVLTLVEEE